MAVGQHGDLCFAFSSWTDPTLARMDTSSIGLPSVRMDGLRGLSRDLCRERDEGGHSCRDGVMVDLQFNRIDTPASSGRDHGVGLDNDENTEPQPSLAGYASRPWPLTLADNTDFVD